MRDELFDELVASLREGAAILRGESAPSRSFHLNNVDIRQIREQLGLSQREFSFLLGISVGTLRNWEQGRRTPEGPARVLLQIAGRHPEVFFDLVQNSDATLVTLTKNVSIESTGVTLNTEEVIYAPYWPQSNNCLPLWTDQAEKTFDQKKVME